MLFYVCGHVDLFLIACAFFSWVFYVVVRFEGCYIIFYVGDP